MTRKAKPICILDSDGLPCFHMLVRSMRTRDGKIVGIKSGAAFEELDSERKQIAVWKMGGEQTGMITAEGYRKANGMCQISTKTPEFIRVPGEREDQFNPHIIQDKAGSFKAGFARTLAFAPGVTGVPVVVDNMTYLDVRSYLVEDLLNVRVRSPYCVMTGPRRVPPAKRLAALIDRHNAEKLALAEEWENSTGNKKQSWQRDYIVSEEEKQLAIQNAQQDMWEFKVVDPDNDFGVWFDTAAEPVNKVYRTYQQTKKFGSRRLTAINYRNTMRQHPLAPAMHIPAGDLQEVRHGEGQWAKVSYRARVRCFTHDLEFDRSKIDELLDQFMHGSRIAGLEVLADSSVADAEAVKAAAGADPGEDPEALPDTTADEGEIEDGPLEASDPRAALVGHIQQGEAALGKRNPALARIRKRHQEAQSSLTASEETLAAYLKDINAAVDAEAMADS